MTKRLGVLIAVIAVLVGGNWVNGPALAHGPALIDSRSSDSRMARQ